MSGRQWQPAACPFSVQGADFGPHSEHSGKRYSPTGLFVCSECGFLCWAEAYERIADMRTELYGFRYPGLRDLSPAEARKIAGEQWKRQGVAGAIAALEGL